MIKQVFNVEHYWKVIVYYNIDYDLFYYISNELKTIGVNKASIKRIHKNMINKKAKAVTISDKNLHISIVLFNKHKSILDYINSIVHEAEHIKQAMLDAYNVNDFGEAPAYTIGFLVMKMIHILYYI